jgi:Uma2 family endonuclease
MTAVTANLPLRGLMAGFRRFTVAEYHKLIETGVLTEDDPVELIEGYLVQKMPRNPLHDGTLSKVEKRLKPLVPPGWDTRTQCAVTLSGSEPEPDFAIVREEPGGYLARHPGPEDVGLVVEVSDSSLDSDRADKSRMYARAGLPLYWIVNLPDRQIEVYEQPSGPTGSPAYAVRRTYRPGDSVPLVLDGTAVGNVPAAEMLP